jgi:hypothetical protein
LYVSFDGMRVRCVWRDARGRVTGGKLEAYQWSGRSARFCVLAGEDGFAEVGGAARIATRHRSGAGMADGGPGPAPRVQ